MFRGANADGTGGILAAFPPFRFDCFNDDGGGFGTFPSIERGEGVGERKQNRFIFVKVRGESRIDFFFEVDVMTRIGVVGFAKPTKERCIEFCHRGFMVVDPYVFAVEHFHGRFLENGERHCNRSHDPERNLHAVTHGRIFEVMFEVVRGPWLLKFFKTKDFVALAGLNMNGVFMGDFCFSDKTGDFGNTWVIILMGFICF